MPIAKIQLQDGRIAKFEVPEGTTQDQVLEFANQQFSSMEQPTPPSQPEGRDLTQEPTMSRGEAALTTGTNVLGLMQRPKAAVAAGAAKMFGGEVTKDIPFSELYGEALGEEKRKLQTAREQYPIQSLTTQLLADAGVLGKLFTGASLAKQGAALGAISSTGEATDLTNIPQTIKEVGTGTAVGAALGKGLEKAIPAVSSAASYIAKAPKQILKSALGVKPEAVKTFQELGINPTLADVSNSASLQNFVKDFPGGGKPLTNALQKQVNDISTQIQSVSKSKGGTYTEAGKELIKGADNIIEQSKARDLKLYGEVDKFIPAETPVSMNNTFNALKDRKVQITSSVSGGKVAGYNKFITDIEAQLQQGKQVPYDSLTALRSEVGTALQGKLEPQERAALNKIYSGLTSDIKDNIIRSDIDKIGKKSALQAWEKANTSHRLRTRFIQENIQPLLDKNTPEEVFRYATSQSKLGGTRINQVMRSLNNDQKEFIRGTVIKDLGLAPKTQQGAGGDVFSPIRFMEQYSVLKNNGADKAIFSPAQRTSFEKLNKVIELTKNTEQAGKKNLLVPSASFLGLGVGTGGMSIPVTMTGARISSSLMANPRFVNWLASTAQASPKEMPKYINQLSKIAAANPMIREEVITLLGSIVSEAEAGEPTKEGLKQKYRDIYKQKYPFYETDEVELDRMVERELLKPNKKIATNPIQNKT